MADTVKLQIADAEKLELTLTITLPVHAWRRVMRSENWNPFSNAVSAALGEIARVSEQAGEIEVR